MSLARDGFALVECAVGGDTIAALKDALAQAPVARSERNGETFGARNLLALTAVRDVLPGLKSIVGHDHRAVRSLFFDKTPGANWPVPWHQDLTLALAARRETPGWTNWTVKRGLDHAQAPAEILARMTTLRLHLDDCGADNGALRVIAGSDARGVLSRSEIAARTPAIRRR